MKFQSKLALGFGGMLLLLFILAGTSIRLMNSVSNDVNTTSTVYLPLQTDASWLRGTIFSIPGSVNLYLYTGQKEFWNQVDRLLAEMTKTLDVLATNIEKNGLSEKKRQVSELAVTLADFEKTLRDTYANNEEFIAARQKMIAQGADAADRATELVAIYTKGLEDAARDDNPQNADRIRNLTALSTKLSTAIAMVRTGMLRSLATQDRTFAQVNFTTHFPAAFQALDGMAQFLEIPANKKKVQDLLRDMEVFKKSQEQIMVQWDQKDVLMQARNTLRDKATSQVNVIANDASAMQTQSMNGVTDSLKSAISQSLTIAVIALLVGIAVAVFLTRNVLQQLGKDPGVLESIAVRVTQGDYNIDDGSPKIGVFGSLVGMVEALKTHIDNARSESQRAADESQHARNAMEKAESASAEALSKTNAMLVAAGRLEEVATVVSSASTELAAQIEQSERGAAQQASRVTETATAMEEMNSTVLEVARNAGTASEVSTQTRSKAEAGAKVVQQAVQSIQQVQAQSLALKDDMQTLDTNARSISQIMSVISDIADQTNLLALNAAIEAARAGDAGRGFAVVADEVRKLAEKTMASTTDVGNAIKAIQQSADKSMAQVDSAVKTIEEATELAVQSGTALQEIVQMVDKTADQVRAIATASEQQSASSEEINQSITQVSQIANETARAMQEAAGAVSDMSHQAQVLTGLIEDLKKS